MKPGCVYLVGAGCGSYDLITVRGLKRLQSCDVVVYDDLIDTTLLSAAAPHAQRIYVGKRLGKHESSQESISQLLVETAQKGNTVVRLKGGDPFVFGRGGEEILALQQAGIPYEVVPGISSAIAIPGLAGIPVTHRGVSRSIHIVTAHTADTEDGLPACFDRLAGLDGTLVFLMGLSRLSVIVRRLTDAGMPPSTPAAVLSAPDSTAPIAVRAPLGSLEEAAKRAGVQAPAIILVGKVAAFNFSSSIPARKERRSSVSKEALSPLSGVTIALTGTGDILERLQPALSALGAQTSVVSSSRIEELPMDFNVSLLYHPCWVVLTSRNGVTCFFQRMADLGVDIRKLNHCRFAVIGPGTASALWDHGVSAELCPEEHTSQGLAEALANTVKSDEPVYLFRSNRGSPILEERLCPQCQVQSIPLYKVIPNQMNRSNPLPADYLVFCSASGVDFYFKHYDMIPAGTVCVCIGPVTAHALVSQSNAEVVTASEISLSGLVQTILSHHKQKAVKDQM